VQCLAEDSARVLWVGTKNGLVRLSESGPENFGTESGLPSANITALLAEASAEDWTFGKQQIWRR
jgi:ligand-binding sensor domain-containing protein